MLAMLVTQQGADYPKQPNTVITGGTASPRPAQLTDLYRSSSSSCVTSRGSCFFYQVWYKPPGWGALLAGGVVHSSAVATVAGPGTPGKAQTVRSGPAHAEKGPGGESCAIAGKLPSAAKAAGRAPQTGGQVMLVESGPVKGGPYRRSGSWGAPGSQPAAGPADGPGSGRPAAWGGLTSRALPYLGSPHQQPKQTAL